MTLTPPAAPLALVAGWFSFEGMGATAGDLLARDLCKTWLAEEGWRADMAVAPPFTDGLDWRTVEPKDYQAVVFVCGPMGNGPPVDRFIERFASVRMIGLDLSMLESVETWNPFEILIERDSDRTSRPDISFLSRSSSVAVVGTVLVHPQSEYEGAMHSAVDATVSRLLQGRDIARITIDTRLDENEGHLRSPSQVESAIARMDAIVTTRLHGMVFAIKNGVPALVIDPIAGGRKVAQQAEAIGWSQVFTADDLDPTRLERALDYCLSAEAREEVGAVRLRAMAGAAQARNLFRSGVASLQKERF